MNNLAGVLQRKGQLREAETLFRESLELRRQVVGPNHPNTLDTQLNLTFDLVAQGKISAAVALHKQMEPLILDRLGAELYATESVSTRRRMVASQSTYQDVALNLAQMPGAGTAGLKMAASALLRLKGLAVEEDAYLAHLARRGEDKGIQAAAAELQGLHAQMARLIQSNGSAQEIAGVTARIDAEQHKLGNLSRNYATSLQVRNASLQDLREHLFGGSAILEMRLYHRIDFKTGTSGPTRLAGVLIPPAGDIIVRDLGPTPAADANVNLLLSASPKRAEKAGTALYEQLLAPFAGDLASLKRLYIAPDGSLNLVSFGLLRATDGKRLVDHLDVRLVQTGRDLLRPPPDKPAKGLVAVGGIDFDLAPVATNRDAARATQMAQSDDRPTIRWAG